MLKHALKLIVVNLAVFLGLLVLLEAGAQALCFVYPSYDVLFLQPDRTLGWKLVPNANWTWAGLHWYGADFLVNVKNSPLGFRDIARPVAKNPDVKRVALLGDSYIEAIQVPFEKTAAHQLEVMLNADSPQSSHPWEALSFGVSNFGVGQYLLAWEQYAKQFHPDYVTIFVAKMHMKRTIDKYESSAFANAKMKTALWVRPTFRVENGELIREPAADFDEFVKAQNNLIEKEFSGSRSRRKSSLITVRYAKILWSGLKKKVEVLRRGNTDSAPDEVPEAALFEVNSAIVSELARSVASSGARLILVDVSRYLGDDEGVATYLEKLCQKEGVGYIPLYKDLDKATASGVPTHWNYDYHFNEAGNEIMARAIHDWVQRDVNAPSGDIAARR